MAICIYCGEKAGLFSKYHEACFLDAEKNRNIGVQSIKGRISVALNNKQSYSELHSDLNQIASRSKLSPEVVGQTVLRTVDEISRHEPLEPTKVNYLIEMCEDILGKLESVRPDSPFYASYQPILWNAAYSGSLWLVMHGQKISFLNPCDVVLQPGENRLAEFGTVLYRKSVMVSSHAGGYNGIGVRVASGLYYRFGAYAGHTVSTPEVQTIDSGFFIPTNKGMYFAGQQTTFRIPYSSILRFKAYPDGLGFFRSIGEGREEIFTIVDTHLNSPGFNPANAVTLPIGWFLYNLVAFLTTPNQGS